MNERAALVMVFMFLALAVVAIAFLISRHLQRRLETREVLAALEHGQALPVRRTTERRTFESDLRNGVLLLAFSAGFAIVLANIERGEGVFVAAIPFFIGVGYLANALIAWRLGKGARPDEPVRAPSKAPESGWVASSAPGAEGSGPPSEPT